MNNIISVDFQQQRTSQRSQWLRLEQGSAITIRDTQLVMPEVQEYVSVPFLEGSTSDTSDQPISTRIKIEGEAPSGYIFIQPIPATLEYVEEDKAWLITDDLFAEYGFGPTIQDARHDYVSGLISFYETLLEWATEENVPTQVQFKQLRAYFTKVD